MINKIHFDGADFKNSTMQSGIYLGDGTSVGSGYATGRSHGAYHYLKWNAKVIERDQKWVHPKGDADWRGEGGE